MMPILNSVYSLDEKKYFIFMPGTTHYDEDNFGNPIYVKDYYYLDSEFRKLIRQCGKENAEEYADKLKKEGKKVIVGDHAPLVETKYGTFVPYSNPDIKGIWEDPTKEQLQLYKRVLEDDGAQYQIVKKLVY